MTTTMRRRRLRARERRRRGLDVRVGLPIGLERVARFSTPQYRGDVVQSERGEGARSNQVGGRSTSSVMFTEHMG